MGVDMKLLFTLAVALLLTTYAAFASTVNYVPTPDGSPAYYPSISKQLYDSTTGRYYYLIAYLTDEVSGGSTVKVYNTETGTTTVCSQGCPYCSRPRISRDGSHVAYYGTANYQNGYSMIVYPVIAPTSGGAGTPALDPNNTTAAEVSTTLWDPNEHPYGEQAPGISDGANPCVTFGDLEGRAAPPEGQAPEWAWKSFAMGVGLTAIGSTPGRGGVPTDCDSGGVNTTYAYLGQVYVNGSQVTSDNSATCNDPSICSVYVNGVLTTLVVAFDSSGTNMGGALAGENVFVLNLITDTLLCPYSVVGSTNQGWAAQPFLSADGTALAFNTTSSMLNWKLAYKFPPLPPHMNGALRRFNMPHLGIGPLSGVNYWTGPCAAECAVTGGGTWVLSFNAASPLTPEVANDACVSTGSGSLPWVGAFDAGSANILSGLPPLASYVYWAQP